MYRAIKGLIDNPQNNLKTFLEGKMIFNEHSLDASNLRRIFMNLFPDTANVETWVFTKTEIFFDKIHSGFGLTSDRRFYLWI